MPEEMIQIASETGRPRESEQGTSLVIGSEFSHDCESHPSFRPLIARLYN